MPVRPEFADRVSQFFENFGHHFTPPTAAPEGNALDPKPDGGERPNPGPKADRSVSDYVNARRARLGLPPVGAKGSMAPEWLKDQQKQAQDETGAYAPENRFDVVGAAAPAVRAMGDIAAETTGIPSVIRGANRIQQAYSEGDPMKGAAGAGEIALGVVPGASALKGAGRALATLPAVAGITAAGGMVGEANAQDQIARQRAVGNERAGTGFWSQIGDMVGGSKPPMSSEEFADQWSKRPGNEAPRVRSFEDIQRDAADEYRKSPAYRSLVEQGAMKTAEARAAAYAKEQADIRFRAQKPIDAQMDAYGARRDAEYQKYLSDQDRLARLPFNEKMPDVAARLPMIGLAASAAIPAALGAAKSATSYLPNSAPSRFNRSVTQAEDAFRQAATTSPHIPTADVVLRGRQLDRQIAEQTPNAFMDAARTYGPSAMIVGGGAAVGAEANMFPYQYDANVLPNTDRNGQPNATKEQAQRDALDLQKWGTKALMNLPTAFTGYKVGTVIPPNTPDVASARGVSDAIAQQYPPSVRDLQRQSRLETLRQDLDRKRQELDRNRQELDRNRRSVDEADRRSSGQTGGPDQSQPPRRQPPNAFETDQEAGGSLADRIRDGRQLIEQETERLRRLREPRHHSNYQPRGEDGKFDGPPSPEWRKPN